MFKKAAYLSSGSLDSRPTYQRDAVDDDFAGPSSGSSDGVNVISWKDMGLGRGPLQGAAYGSMVMPQFKGGRKANKGNRPLPNLLASVSLPGAPAPALSAPTLATGTHADNSVQTRFKQITSRACNVDHHWLLAACTWWRQRKQALLRS